MSEHESQYDPALEKIIETSGSDIGRVKDKDTAQVLADSEARNIHSRSTNIQEFPYQEFNDQNADRIIKDKIARGVIGDSSLAFGIAHDHYQGDIPKKEVDKVQTDIKSAFDSYENLKQEAKPIHLAEENARLKEQLDEARARINDLKDPSPQ